MKYVIVFNNNGMGKAEPELSHKLAFNFVKLLNEEAQLPSAILFYAEGVKLCCESSIIIDGLKQLEQNGVKMIACTTCLNYYNIKEKLLVGNAGTMADILLYQIKADKIIAL